MKESVEQVRSASSYVCLLFGVEAVACPLLPAEMFGAARTGLPFLVFIAGLCTIAAGIAAFRASRAPGAASLVLAIVLTTGTFVSALVFGIPGTQSILTVSLAILGYGSGVFLAIAAWFASYTLHGAPALDRRVRHRHRRDAASVTKHRHERSDSWAA